VLRLEISHRAVFAAVLAVVAVWIFFNLWPIVVILATSFILMAALLPYVEWLHARRIPRTAAVVIIMLAILGALAGLFALVVPPLVDEFSDLETRLPEDAARFDEFLGDIGINLNLEQRARDIDWDRVISGEVAIDLGQRVIAIIVGLVTIFVLTAYLLADTPRMSRFLYQFVTPGREPEVDRVLQALSRVVGGYIRGQVITTAIITLFTFVVLTAAGVPNAVAFAIFAGFVDIIPIIGAVIAVVVPTLAAFQESPTQGVVVLVALIAYQQFEDRILTPRVYGATMNLPPVIVLVAVLIGAHLYGIIGVLLALPAAATARVALDFYLERRSVPIVPPRGPTEEVLAPNSPTGEEA
jgi:putative heme transporter